LLREIELLEESHRNVQRKAQNCAESPIIAQKRSQKEEKVVRQMTAKEEIKDSESNITAIGTMMESTGKNNNFPF